MHPSNYGRSVVKGNSVRDALNRGYRLGFTSGGEHEGVGVTAVYAEKLTREAIFNALKKRHTYGTTGARIFLDFRVDGHLMGEEFKSKNKTPVITLNITGTSDIKSIKLVRSGMVLKEWKDAGKKVQLKWTDDSLSKTKKKNNHYYYGSVSQEDGEIPTRPQPWTQPHLNISRDQIG